MNRKKSNEKTKIRKLHRITCSSNEWTIRCSHTIPSTGSHARRTNGRSAANISNHPTYTIQYVLTRQCFVNVSNHLLVQFRRLLFLDEVPRLKEERHDAFNWQEKLLRHVVLCNDQMNNSTYCNSSELLCLRHLAQGQRLVGDHWELGKDPCNERTAYSCRHLQLRDRSGAGEAVHHHCWLILGLTSWREAAIWDDWQELWEGQEYEWNIICT